MNSIYLGSFTLLSLPVCKFHPPLPTKSQQHVLHCGTGLKLSSISMTSKSTTVRTPLQATDSNMEAQISVPEGTATVVHFEEVIEKDWSVLDFAESSSAEEFKRSINRIISVGKIGESSRILVSTGSEEFVDCLVDSSSFKSLLVLHESLLTLAGIKEKYDKVKCWQGEITIVPEKWGPFDVVFLYFLPALPFELDDILGSLANKCSPGGKVIISHPQGRKVLEQQRQKYPDIVVSDLPEEAKLQGVAAAHSFEVAEFVDEPGLYLAVLTCLGA